MMLSIKVKIILLSFCLVLLTAFVIGFAVQKFTLIEQNAESSVIQDSREETLAIIGATLMFALAIAIIFSLKIIEPIDEVIIGTQLVAQGRLDHRIRKRSHDEIGRLVDSFNNMIKKLRATQERSSEYSNIATVEKKKAELIIDSMADGVIVTDQHHRVELINPAAERLFEFDGVNIIGKHIVNFLKRYKLENLFQEFPDISEKMLPDPNARVKVMEYNVNKPRVRVLKVTMAPLKNYSDVVIGTVTVIEDVTKERELDELKTEFVSTVSHELRTPLTSIKGYASLLAEGKLGEMPEPQSKSIKIIDREADRLADLINDILDLSKLEAGKMKANFEEASLASIIRECSLVSEAKAKGIDVKVMLPKNLPNIVLDRTKIMQVISNILSNAIKFTKKGGRITIKATNHRDLIHVDITDTGAGIPKKEIPKLFNKFYQVESHLTRNQGGTGLGLPIVKEIIGLHHGLLSVCSKPKKGTTVSFALPKVPPGKEPALNCWEERDCGKVNCPAYNASDKRCWLFIGTHCKMRSNEPTLNKIDVCKYCDVYKSAFEDEKDTDSR